MHSFVQDYNEGDPRTHKGYNLRKMSMAALYKEYGLDPMTVDFIGHAIALHRYAALTHVQSNICSSLLCTQFKDMLDAISQTALHKNAVHPSNDMGQRGVWLEQLAWQEIAGRPTRTWS